jgi:hypothetical protein
MKTERPLVRVSSGKVGGARGEVPTVSRRDSVTAMKRVAERF